MTRLISFVHLSDFHFRKDYLSIERANLIVSDIIKNLPQNDVYLIFSGDLAFSGERSQYEFLLEHIFIPLEPKFRKIYLVPGNHDIYRVNASVDEAKSIFEDKTQSYLFKSSDKSLFVCPYTKSDPLANYFDFQNLISSPAESTYFYWYDKNEQFSIVGLNSTWLSYDRGSDKSDKGNLRIDTAVIDRAIKKINRNTLNIVVSHHPLDWMEESTQQPLMDRIVSNFDILLTGHNHFPRKVYGEFDTGKCLLLQAPAAKARNTVSSNAYSIINVEIQNKYVEIIYRSFSELRNQFVFANDICDNGIKYPNDIHKNYFSEMRTHSVSGLLETFKHSISNFDTDNWYSKNFTRKTKRVEKFYEPKISRLKYLDGIEISNVPRPISEALSVTSNLQIVIGAKDSGLSTAAYVFVKSIMLSNKDLQIVPTYVNLSNKIINKASILQEATRGCVVSSFSHKQIEMLAEAGSLLFVFDQISIQDTRRFNELIFVLERFFEKSKTIIFAHNDVAPTPFTEDEIKIDLLNEQIYKLEELMSEDIRELIDIIRPSKSEEQKAVLLNNVVASFKQMDEPIYPSSVCILLDTLDQIPDFRPINRVKLLDRYVECLMGRFDLQDVEEGTFNSTEKIKLLSFIAGKMAVNNAVSIDIKIWEEMLREYETSKMIEVPEDLLKEFQSKGIIFVTNQGVTFRADYLYTYFIAREMNVNAELFNFIMFGDNFFTFHRELVFFGELDNVNVGQLLKSTMNRIEELEFNILEYYESRGVNLDKELALTMLDDHTNKHSVFKTAVDGVESTKPSQKTEDFARNRDLAQVGRGRGVQSRQPIIKLEARWYSAIRTYCQIIRHNTSGSAAEKRLHINKALDSCRLFFKTLVAKRKVLSSKRFMVFSGILYFNPRAGDESSDYHHKFKVALANSVGKNIVEYLANPLLSPAFRDILSDEDEIMQFFIRYLMLELPHEKMLTHTYKVSKSQTIFC